MNRSTRLRRSMVSRSVAGRSGRAYQPVAIPVLRGQRVLLDAELAVLYGVTTKRLNEQVRRNLKRFPADFTSLMRAGDSEALRSQIATSSPRARLPLLSSLCPWPEHGAINGSSLNCARRASIPHLPGSHRLKDQPVGKSRAGHVHQIRSAIGSCQPLCGASNNRLTGAAMVRSSR